MLPEDTVLPENTVHLTVSVITPSFNQAAFLAGCLSSVASQSFAAGEHLVLDPGSTDGSRDIATAAGVTVITEGDRGQAHAVGRGFQQSTGDVVAWLNADDRFADEDVLSRVVDRFAQPDRPDVVYGLGLYVDADGNPTEAAVIQGNPALLDGQFARGVGLLQPATFVHRRVIDRIGVPDPELDFAMDYEYWMRAFDAGLRFVHLPRVLAHATVHADAKTVDRRGESLEEAIAVARRRNGYLSDAWARRWIDHQLTGADGMFAWTDPTESRFGDVVRGARKLLWKRNLTVAGLRALARASVRGDRAALGTVAMMFGRTPR